ncbi:Predicted dithiol-disulfide isomerase, DsbA family [Micromonospora inyonensis]|uniref:Predicted dithiol-disulfide isomerase, DsbA family n=2 Tax=Micromonospora inyonensis TaxID=47866 RepID=A0A1C6RFE5_9ACTN|nr:Predicted dithiol-disulfide isomerase, DsbA family [Micromonospora inyonensis]
MIRGMEIEVYADVVCPWCYVGKRRLEQALAAYDGDVTLRYRPFQLDPSPVPEPRPLLDGLAAKFGGVEQARQMADHVAGVAAGVGLKLDFDRAVTANTFDAHRLIRFADARGRAAETIEGLFKAHFTDGVDIGSRSALASVAASVGLDAPEVRAFLDSDAGVAELQAELAEARSIGVTSVPTFVLAGRYAVSGAQEPETLLAALAEVERRESSDG